MKNQYYIMLLVIFSTKIAFSQKCYTIYDSISKEPISYVNIWKENKIYSNSDEKGWFCVKENEFQDNFKITCVGYKAKVVNTAESSIFMSKDVIVLKEVIIANPSYKKKIKLGKSKAGNTTLVATYDLQVAEVGKSFVLENSTTQFLNKIKFHTFSSSPNRIVGIKIYSLNDNKEPKDLLTTENILCSIKKGSRTTTADLSKFSLHIPKEGFFVSIQILLIDQNKQFGEYNKDWFFYEPSIGATSDVVDASSYHSSQEGIWKKYENLEINIEVELSN